MSSIWRMILFAALLGLLLLPSGCGGHKDPPNPGQGEDAPVMDQVPDPPKPN